MLYFPFQAPLFNGFDSHEIRLAKDKSEIRTNQVKKEHQARGVLFTPYSHSRSPFLPVSSSTKSMCATQNQGIAMLKHERSASPKPILHRTTPKLKMNGDNINKIKEKIQQSKAKHVPEVKCRPNEKKFVLPVRSAHSSRVIKPNKRFRDVDGESSDQGDSVPKKLKLSSETSSSSPWINKTGMLVSVQ